MDYKEIKTLDGYVSLSNIIISVAETEYPSRCGRVKRAPNLDEYDTTEPYNEPDESHFEERK